MASKKKTSDPRPPKPYYTEREKLLKMAKDNPAIWDMIKKLDLMVKL